MSLQQGLPYTPQPYPSVRHHVDGRTCIVHDEIEDQNLGEGWSGGEGRTHDALNPRQVVGGTPVPVASASAPEPLGIDAGSAESQLKALQQEHEELQQAHAQLQQEHEDTVSTFNGSWDELKAKHDALEKEYQELQQKHDALLAAATPPPEPEAPQADQPEGASRKRGK